MSEDEAAGATLPESADRLVRGPLCSTLHDDLRNTDAIGRRAIGDLASLRRTVLLGDVPQRNLALGLLLMARQSAMPEVLRPPGALGRLERAIQGVYRCGSRIEAYLGEVARHLRSLRARNSTWARRWTIERVLFSTGVAATIILGDSFAALALLVVRMLGSLASGSSWSFPAEERWNPREARGQLLGCLAGHLSDAIVLMAITVGVSSHRGTTWGLLVAGALVAQLLATLMRVAMLQVGLRLVRLRLERVIRSGGILVALFVIGLIQLRTSVLHWPALALLVAIPTYAYAVLEVARTSASFYMNRQQPVSLLLGGEEIYTGPVERPSVSAQARQPLEWEVVAT